MNTPTLSTYDRRSLIVGVLLLALSLLWFFFPSLAIQALNLAPRFFNTLQPVAGPADPLWHSFACGFLAIQGLLFTFHSKTQQKSLLWICVGSSALVALALLQGLSMPNSETKSFSAYFGLVLESLVGVRAVWIVLAPGSNKTIRVSS